MVEHVDRRIGKLLRHSKAADKFSVGHEQRRLGEHVTNCGALLADWLVLVHFHSTKESPGPKPRALVCHRLSRRAWAINLAGWGVDENVSRGAHILAHGKLSKTLAETVGAIAATVEPATTERKSRRDDRAVGTLFFRVSWWCSLVWLVTAVPRGGRGSPGGDNLPVRQVGRFAALDSTIPPPALLIRFRIGNKRRVGTAPPSASGTIAVLHLFSRDRSTPIE